MRMNKHHQCPHNICRHTLAQHHPEEGEAVRVVGKCSEDRRGEDGDRGKSRCLRSSACLLLPVCVQGAVKIPWELGRAVRSLVCCRLRLTPSRHAKDVRGRRRERMRRPLFTLYGRGEVSPFVPTKACMSM